MLGSNREHASDPLGMIEASLKRYGRDQEIIHEQEDSLRHWLRIVSGLTRTCVLRSDGKRQIIDFLLPGDFFGFIDNGPYAFTVEAVVDGTQVARYPRERVKLLADSDPHFGRWIRGIAFDGISRLQGRMLALGSVSSVEKVGAFLLELADRSPQDSAGAVSLPMSRYDIADYLGISAETVSRAVTKLKRQGVIHLLGTRQVRIVNRAALMC
jgi:CRP/FNR family transcriptional regulator, nitrogen fixation regulation protein